MVSRLVLILGDQLSEEVSALREADRESDVVVMAEVMDEASYVPHHPKKIAFLFAAMRKFAAYLEKKGWRVRYTRLDDAKNTGSIPGELLRASTSSRMTGFFAHMPSSRPGQMGAKNCGWSGSIGRCGARQAS